MKWLSDSRPCRKLNRPTNHISHISETDFLFLGSKITADGDCRHEIRRWLLLGRKTMTNLDSALKSKDIALPTKVRTVKATVFPVAMYGCESWTIKKVQCRRTGVFKLWCGEDSWESLGQQGDKPVDPKENQSWIFIDAGAEAPIFWPPEAKSWLI